MPPIVRKISKFGGSEQASKHWIGASENEVTTMPAVDYRRAAFLWNGRHACLARSLWQASAAAKAVQDGKEGRKEGRKGLTLEIDRWRCVPKLSSGFAFPLGDLVRARPEEKKYMLPRSPPPEVSLAHRVRARACKLCSSTHMVLYVCSMIFSRACIKCTTVPV